MPAPNVLTKANARCAPLFRKARCHALHQNTENCDDQDGYEGNTEEAKPWGGEPQGETDVHARHDETAVAEVYDLQNAEDQRETHGNQGVNASESDTVDDLLL